MTTSDLLISDVLIVTTAVATPVATSVVTESSSIHKPTSVSNPGVQLKLKIDESGLGLMKETSSSEVRNMYLSASVISTACTTVVMTDVCF